MARKKALPPILAAIFPKGGETPHAYLVEHDGPAGSHWDVTVQGVDHDGIKAEAFDFGNGQYGVQFRVKVNVLSVASLGTVAGSIMLAMDAVVTALGGYAELKPMPMPGADTSVN